MEEKLKEFYRLKYLDFTCYDVSSTDENWGDA